MDGDGAWGGWGIADSRMVTDGRCRGSVEVRPIDRSGRRCGGEALKNYQDIGGNYWLAVSGV